MKHHRIVRREFSKQAPKFAEAGYTPSSQDLLDWIVDRLPLDKGYQVLDVAAGTGHFSLAIAPRVQKVFAVDITREMLTFAREETARRNLNNISFKAIKVYEQQLAFPREINDSNYEGIALSRLVFLHYQTGKKDKGIMLAKQGLRIFESIGAPQVDVIRNMLKQWGMEE